MNAVEVAAKAALTMFGLALATSGLCDDIVPQAEMPTSIAVAGQGCPTFHPGIVLTDHRLCAAHGYSPHALHRGSQPPVHQAPLFQFRRDNVAPRLIRADAAMGVGPA